jgi:hypothetical protein
MNLVKLVLHENRKIQSLRLSVEYKNKCSDVSKWQTHFFGLAFLPTDEIEDCFVELIADEKCRKFADYILETYIDGN